MDMTADIKLEKAGDIATLTFNRPEKRNAINHAMWKAIPDLVAEVDADPFIALLVVTGAGGHFAAGADISEFETTYATPETTRNFSADVARAGDALMRLSKPSIAVIRGACVGGGCGIALSCDLRFAAHGSRFGITPAKLGLAYSLEDTKRLVDVVGPQRAKDILFSGRLLDADEAFRFGLIDRLTADAELDQAAEDYARTVAANSLYSLRATKAIVGMILEGAVAETKESARISLESFQGGDFKEGSAAFLQKRKPNFRKG